MAEAHPLVGQPGALDVVVSLAPFFFFFFCSIELRPRFARVAGLLTQIQRVLIECFTVDLEDSALGQVVGINVDSLEERLAVLPELTKRNESRNNSGLRHFASGFGLDLDSAHDAHLSVFWESRRERILLSVIIGASSDAPDIFKKRSNPSNA